MKKRIFSLLLALVMAVSLLPVSAFAEGEDYDLRVLTFEDADYKGGTNFANGNNWSSLIDDPQYGGKLLYGSSGAGVYSADEAYQWTDTNNTWLHNILSEGYGSWCYWSGGHAISNYNTGDIADYGGFNTQLTVYKKGVSGLSRTGGGHNGSNNFAVHYGYADNSGYGLSADALPALTFADGPERVIDHMYVTNTTYALNCYIDGNGLTAKIGPDDWVKLVATGYDTKGAKTGETDIYLCNGPDNIIMDWTKWDLSSLGKVSKVTFNVTGSSDNGYGFSQPAYFAYDDVAVRFEKAGADVPATGVTLDKTELSLTEGESATLTATVEPENATDKAIVWTSSDNAVATVENGVVTAVKAGTATITAACGSAKAECTVTVTAAPAGPISVKVGSAAYPVKPIDGQAGKYHAAVPYGSNATIEVKDAAFLMVTNSKGGYLNDEGSNPFTLTAAQLDKLLISKDIPFTPANSASKVAYLSIMDAMAGTSYELYIELTRKAVPATGVTLSETALSLRPTEKATLAATVAPENTTDTLVWTSSNDAVATVKDGVITAKSEGTATITAACGSVTASTTVTVLAIPTDATGTVSSGTTSANSGQVITVTPSYVVLKPGATRTLTAKATPASASQSFTYKSGNSSVATVSPSGVITAVGTGSTSITVSNGKASALVTVIVNRSASASSGSDSSNGDDASSGDDDKITLDPTVQTIQDSTDHEVVFAQSEVPVITGDILNSLRTTGKTLCVVGDGYTMQIAGSGVKSTTSELDTMLILTESDQGIEFELDKGKALPCSVRIDLDVSTYTRLYLYNAVSNKWQYLNSYTDGIITADTAGRYLLTNQNLKFANINWTFFIAGGVVVVLIGIAYVVLKKRYWFW